MNSELKKELSTAIKQGIEQVLNDTPGIERHLDWFSIRAASGEEHNV